MNKDCDLLVTWIKSCDYPYFRKWLWKYREEFNKVIVLFSEHNRFPYFDHFIHDALKDLDITFVDSQEVRWGEQDWRNISTNHMLHLSDSEWVCSIEQDFFAKDWDRLLTSVSDVMDKCDMTGYWQDNNNYIHPAFWFIKRAVLEETTKNFAAEGPHDHFGWITEDVKIAGKKITTIQELGFNCNVEPDADCFHLGGVNQNYLEGMKEGYVFHRPEIFSAYNYACKKLNVIQDPRHVRLMHNISMKLPEVDPKWTPFFELKS